MLSMRQMLRLDPVSTFDPQAHAWHRQHSRTPDLHYLEQHVRQNIFIPDDLKLGLPNHKLIDGHLPVHPSCYTLKPFTTWKKDLGSHSFPLPFEEGVDFEVFTRHKPEPARLQGELYTLPSHYFWKVLDIHKQNGVQFERKRVSISLPWREVTYSSDPNAAVWVDKIPSISRDYVRTIRAWMYVALPEYWSDFIGVSLGTRGVPTYEHDTPKDWISQYSKF